MVLLFWKRNPHIKKSYKIKIYLNSKETVRDLGKHKDFNRVRSRSKERTQGGHPYDSERVYYVL